MPKETVWESIKSLAINFHEAVKIETGSSITFTDKLSKLLLKS